MTRQELNALRVALARERDTTVVATPDHKLLLKGAKESLNGTWATGSGSSYVLSVTKGGRTVDLEGTIDEKSPDNKILTIAQFGVSLIFEK